MPLRHQRKRPRRAASFLSIHSERSETVLRLAALLIIALASLSPALAQSNDAATLAAIANNAINEIPAKKLFGAQKTPANMAARSIGTYAKGCLAGAQALPVNGPAWQVMRL